MSTDERWLIVGLGNPESEYGGTRHNVGADAVRRLAEREHTSLSRNKKVRCELADIRVGDTRATLAVPTTYMNLSGAPVQAAARWIKAPPARIIVLYDELDLEPGTIRLKQGGGAGGHNGIKDIDRALGSKDYFRVRIGIGRPPGRMAPKDWVLRRFSPAERAEIDVTIEHALDAALSLIRVGLEPTQNLYHGR